MIGYYVHHHGRGHLHRAAAVAAAVDTAVVGLSSLPRPAGWAGPWIELSRDDEGPTPVDASAHGRLHWAPERDRGLAARMAQVSAWIAEVDPALMVVDVSVEVATLARLHGVPVVTTILPGDRSDAPHDLVHGIARRIVAAWPDDVVGLCPTLDAHADRVTRIGGMSRYDGRAIEPRDPVGSRRVLVLAGAGDADGDTWDLTAARAQTPGWTWDVLGPGTGWVDDPWDLLCRADVVVTHAGQNAVAEVAAARRPAIVVPRPRPFGEQDFMAAALAADGRFPVTVFPTGLPRTGWAGLLDRTAAMDGAPWAAWNDGQGARRFAGVVRDELDRTTAPTA